MKALGLGLGAFGFHEVSVHVADGGAPSLIVTGRGGGARDERGVGGVPPVAVPRRASRRSPWWSPMRRVVAMIPIVTPEEMCGDRCRRARSPSKCSSGGPAQPSPRCARQMLGGTYGRVVNVVAGKGNNGADGGSPASCSPPPV